jgi:hypothetical protein
MSTANVSPPTEWRWHAGPLPCSRCGEQAEVYWVRWRRTRKGLRSSADQHLCQACAERKMAKEAR